MFHKTFVNNKVYTVNVALDAKTKTLTDDSIHCLHFLTMNLILSVTQYHKPSVSHFVV